MKAAGRASAASGGDHRRRLREPGRLERRGLHRPLRHLGNRDQCLPRSSGWIPTRDTKTALTSFDTEAAAKIDWAPLRHFWFTSKSGPPHPQHAGPAPGLRRDEEVPACWCSCTAVPHTMYRDQISLRWNYHLLAAPGYVPAPDRLHGLDRLRRSLRRRNQGRPLAAPARTSTTPPTRPSASSRFVDATRQAAAGASYGGHLANWMQATTTPIAA
jgi:hypothetical protein